MIYSVFLKLACTLTGKDKINRMRLSSLVSGSVDRLYFHAAPDFSH